MTATTSPQDAATLSALALALVTQPRASLQELAKAIGVSKATLYRFCRTREQLVARLIAHMKAKGGCWFATHEQVARWCKDNAPA